MATITFYPINSQEHALEIVKNINGTIYLWYIGSNGLRKDGIRYYQKMIRRLLVIKNVKIILVDLTAWGAFFDSNKKLSDFNINVNAINNMNIDRICSIESHTFFDWMINVTNVAIINFINDIMSRDELFAMSKNYNNSNIIFGNIFTPNNPSILQHLINMDTSKTYSAIQYIEALYLIYSLVKTNICDICFMLPNDETKYYNEKYFSDDLTLFLKLMNLDQLIPKVNVHFIPFKYSTNLKARPYNAGKEILNEITLNHLC